MCWEIAGLKSRPYYYPELSWDRSSIGKAVKKMTSTLLYMPLNMVYKI